jgi:uncharacterized protein (DUF934 family)
MTTNLKMIVAPIGQTPTVVNADMTVIRLSVAQTAEQTPQQLTEQLLEQLVTQAIAPAPIVTFIPVAVWLRLRETSPAVAAQYAVWLAPDDDPAQLAVYVGELRHIAIEFPAFKFGQGYSSAYLLRQRYGYRGELRAIGDVLRDQLQYMQRSGFDAFVTRPDRDIHEAIKGLSDFSVFYQSAADGAIPVFRQRHAESSTATVSAA